MDVNVLDYIVQEALILIPVLGVLGTLLKQMPFIPNWLIPFLITLFGVLGACGLLGFSVPSAIQGILISGAEMLGYQMIKQVRDRGDS